MRHHTHVQRQRQSSHRHIGETKKINISGLLSFVDQDYEIYPGSVIYIPRHVGKIEGIALYATLAPIFSSLALSIASLNSINN